MNERISLGGLSDEELVSQLESLCQVERRVSAAIIAHLCEVERRRLHLDAGYSSLYTYCVERLGFSENMAYKRMRAARIAARHPEVLGYLEDNELSLSTLVVIAPHLEEHGPGLLEASRGMNRREVERLVAELSPGQFPLRAKMESVAGGRVRLEVVVGEETARLLQEAIDLDRHLDAAGDVAGLLDRALGYYLKGRRKAKLAETSRPRATPQGHPSAGSEASADGASPSTSKRISAAVMREVVQRDGHQCAWIGPDGHRCRESSFLEFDHVQARALGGTGQTSRNVRLLCRAHNMRAAERSLGQSYIARARGDIESALVNSGSARKEAREGARAALAQATPDAPIVELIRSAFQYLGSAMELSRTSSP